jgi:hypothetical protein
MAGGRPQPDVTVTRSRLDTAGNTLIEKPTGPKLADRDEALAIIGAWRAAHAWPLNAVKVNPRLRTRKVDPFAVVAQRMKRLASIDAKLRREPTMKLSNMHDIGGCRAVVADIDKVRPLVEMSQAGRDISELHRTYDYLANPKRSGYRGVHLVYKYRSMSDKNAVWNGLKIEVQIRSRLQHLWATALETVDTFTGQQLKAGAGGEEWLRFFALMGSVFATQEGCPTVPNTPEDPAELIRELRHLYLYLNVDTVLSGWQEAIQILGDKRPRAARYFLLVLDADAQTITVTTYTRREQAMASDAYLQIEEKAQNNPRLNAVLASAESITALESAFPNYYLDTTDFRIAALMAVNTEEITRDMLATALG